MKNIHNISTTAPGTIKKTKTNKQFNELTGQLCSLQNILYAEGKHSLLIVLQGMDTSGKDGTIRHVFSRMNPQGCDVQSFKTPSEIENKHDFLWRINANLPEKGMIQVFNRSHYEDILFPVVHKTIEKKIVDERVQSINNFEEHLQKNNTIVLKFYLHISKKEQQKRLKERMTDPKKNWKHNPNDKKESEKWNEYMDAYQNVFDNCHKASQWNIIPADDKWYRNYLIAEQIVKVLTNLKMKYPENN